MATAYDNIMNTHNVDIWSEISRVLLLIMYSLFSKVVTGYHVVKDKYMEYKYTTDSIHPTSQYYLTSYGRQDFKGEEIVPEDCVYIEEWIDTKGIKKMMVLYEDEEIPTTWAVSPFDMAPAKCPWVWVGDRETEIDLTRTFDKFLVPGNVITIELVSRLIKITEYTSLIYIETKTFNQVKFPGEGITIELDVDPAD